MIDWIELTVALAMVVLTTAAVFISFRRNGRAIEAFEYGDLTELKLCARDHRKRWLEKKLDTLGWDFVNSTPVRRGSSQLLFRRRPDEDALPLKEVLHVLNRAMALPAGPPEFKREVAKAKTNAQTH